MDKEFAQNIIKAQMDVSQYLEEILIDLEMDKLPETEKKQMKQILTTALEKSFMGSVMEMADERQVGEMNLLIADEDGVMKIMDYVSQNFDKDGELLAKVLDDFRRVIVEKMKFKE